MLQGRLLFSSTHYFTVVHKQPEIACAENAKITLGGKINKMKLEQQNH